jgi:hypothetical protein
LCVRGFDFTPFYDFLLDFREKGRDTLFDAINKRQDDVYCRLYDELNSLSLVPLNEIKYHRSCYKVLERVFIVDTEASLIVLLNSGTSLTNRCKFILLV